MRNITTVLMSLLYTCLALENPNVTYIILSQNNDYNDKLAGSLEKHIKDQYNELKLNLPKIHISNKHFNVAADWTISPLILPISEITENSTQWVLFLEDRTNVSLALLMQGLRKYDVKEEIWIGHALYDSDATIIHHFAFHEDPTFFKYPYLGSGMALSISFLKRLKTRIVENSVKRMDFHIDPEHEFALFVYNNGQGPMIQHDDMFCCKAELGCATHPKIIQPCGKPDVSSIYFAVKTCQKFHKDRVETVKKTWGKYSLQTFFFSDHVDPKLPTISLGMKNTEQGHCEKTMAILRYADREFDGNPKLQWLALVDDDTILSVSRISSLTTCHNTTQPLMVGERYRFGAQGFNYATGGAGILINRAALKVLDGTCSCPRADAPDDMILGACASQLSVVLTHVPQMHQARPPDYASCRLANQDAISFHKHWMIDPVDVYRQWFEKDDSIMVETSRIKTEL